MAYKNDWVIVKKKGPFHMCVGRLIDQRDDHYLIHMHETNFIEKFKEDEFKLKV